MIQNQFTQERNAKEREQFYLLFRKAYIETFTPHGTIVPLILACGIVGVIIVTILLAA